MDCILAEEIYLDDPRPTIEEVSEALDTYVEVPRPMIEEVREALDI